MSIIHVLSGPVIGAVIGYCTNYIAVKMLFRPLRPVHLFGRQLPFTPGIIPKGQARLARAIGGVVGDTLLTEEDLQQMLLTEEVQNQLRISLDNLLREKEEVSLKELCLQFTDETGYETGRAVMQETLTDMVADRVLDMGLGEIISQKVLEAVRQKVSGSLLGMMISGDMLDSFAEPIRSSVDRYLEGNVGALLAPQVSRLWSETEEKHLGEVDQSLREANIDLTEIVMQGYKKLVAAKAADLLGMLHLGKVAEDKVMSLEPEELEKLVMSVMKKELGAVINLGALVGFLIGLLNLIF